MKLTPDQVLQKGIEAHKAGKAHEADQYYTAILKANPKHPDANHNMGVLAVGIGKDEEALPFFKTALEVNPNIAQYWLSYINTLIKLDRIADAKVIYDQAKTKGAQGDGFDKLEARLSSSGSKDSTLFETSTKSLKNHINTFYTDLHSEVLNYAATGWLYDLRFDQKFLAKNEEINLHAKINNSKNVSNYTSQNQYSAFNSGNVVSKLNKIENVEDKFHTLFLHL